eukprot:scaffold617_cov400-Pavlova_lutheri.AAC.4
MKTGLYALRLTLRIWVWGLYYYKKPPRTPRNQLSITLKSSIQHKGTIIQQRRRLVLSSTLCSIGGTFSLDRDSLSLQTTKPACTCKASPQNNSVPGDQRWTAKLAYFAPFAVEYRPGSQNITADYLSLNPPSTRPPIIRILDLCAGMGTVLRALWHLIPTGYPTQVDYIAVEIEEHARKVIQRVFAEVNLDRPGLFHRTDIFRYGNDVRVLAHRRKVPPVHLLIAGVPCQPFSKANTSPDYPSYGLRDERELFTT